MAADNYLTAHKVGGQDLKSGEADAGTTTAANISQIQGDLKHQ